MKNVTRDISVRPEKWTALFLVLFALFLGACADKHAEEGEKARPVRVVEIKQEKRPVRLPYIGTLNSKDIKKYAFKMPGKVAAIRVEKGQRVAKGTLLAELDPTDVGFAVSAAVPPLRKANEAYEEAESFYQRIRALHEKGSVTSDDHDKAKLNRDVREADYRRAQVDLEYKERLSADLKMYSEIDGYVVEILNKPGEIVGAGYPVVVVRNDRQVVQVGVSQKDVKQIRIGTPTALSIDGIEGKGRVSNIAQIPDLQSRTYTVEVTLDDKLAASAFYLGSIAKVWFEIGEKEAVWVPVQAIQSDGQEYVYVVEGEHARRRTITLGAIENTFVEAEGLAPGETLVVEGMKDLHQGAPVSIVGR